MLIAFLCFMIIAAYIQARLLHQEKDYRDMVGFLVVWFLSTTFVSLVIVEVPLPGILDILDFIYNYLGI